MDEWTREAKNWLEKRYRKVHQGKYYAHQPIYGYGCDCSEPNSVRRLARTYHLIKIFESLQFDSFLDIGGGEGYIASIVSDLFNIPAYSSDLSSEANQRAREIFGIPSLASDATRLPFADHSFDLVLCSEVIEHLSKPVFALSELKRIARKYVVITTEEFCPLGELERRLRLFLMDDPYAHTERNWFTRSDFEIAFGSGILLSSQIRKPGETATQYLNESKLTRAQIEKILEVLTATDDLDSDHQGVIVIIPSPGNEIDRRLIHENPLQPERKKMIFGRLISPTEKQPELSPSISHLDPYLLNSLICPSGRGPLNIAQGQLVCVACQALYQVENGVPLMYPAAMVCTVPDVSEGEAVEVLSSGNDKRAKMIHALMEKLHKEKRPHKNPYLRVAAWLFLRFLWLAKRPEPLSKKFQRIMRRVFNLPNRDPSLLDELL